MDCDLNKIDEVVMALLYLTMFEHHGITRAWKNHDWDALNRLHEKGWILYPKGKSKSVGVTNEGRQAAKDLFQKHFGISV